MDLATAIRLVIDDVRANFDGAADCTDQVGLAIAHSELTPGDISSAVARAVISQRTADAYQVVWAADWDELAQLLAPGPAR